MSTTIISSGTREFPSNDRIEDDLPALTDEVIGSSVWLTQSVKPYTTVTIEAPGLRIRPGAGADIVADAGGGLAQKESTAHLDLGAWI